MADLTGSTLGKYQVISRLGRGGMAEVYRAYQPGMDRYVAVKVMHGHMVEQEGFVERFKKEAQIVGALRHPNIVQVIDFDTQENVYYMVMEYIQGETLSAMLKQRGALPIREALTIARKLADAVSYAHQEGMLHRDIKPANVLFTKAGEPVLTDFGIARIMGSTHMTQSGIVLGTPAYMSPEAGRGERVDERSDVYSLGIVLYEMLIGHVPFDADTPYAVIFKHITDPLPSPRTLNPEISEAVERVVLKSLAKNLEDRYQSAADMRNALDVALGSTPSEAPYLTAPLTAAQAAAPVPRATRHMDTPGGTRAAQAQLATEEPRRRSPLPLILGLVALLAIGVVGVLALINSQQGQVVPTQTSIAALGTSTVATMAVLPPITMTPTASPFTTETANAVAVVATASDTPASSATPTASSTPTATHTSIPTATLTASPTPIPPTTTPMIVALAPPTTEALIARVRGDIDDGRLEDALTRVAPYRELYPEDADVKLLEAFALLQFREDPAKLETAHANIEDILAADPKNGAAHFILGLYYRDAPVNDLDQAVNEFNLAIENDFATEDVYWARANANRYRDVPKAEALQDFQRALDLAPGHEAILMDRGMMLLYDMLDPVAALRDFEESYHNAPYPWKHDLLGVAYLKLDRAEEAFALYQQGVQGEMATQAYYVADAAYVALAAGHPDLAREWAERALNLDPQSSDARQTLGLVSEAEGDYEGAIAQLDSVVEGSDGQPFLNWQFSHELKEDRARVLALLGRTDEAIALYQQVVDEFGAWWPSPYLALGQLTLDQGDVEAARGYFTQALDTATAMHDTAGAAAAESGFVDTQIVEALDQAESLLDEGNAQGAVDVLDEAIDRFDPQWPDVYLLLGRAQGELDDLDAARDSLNRAREIALADDDADAVEVIDEAERQLFALQPPSGEGTIEEQIDALETFIEDSGTEDVQYYINLGMLYREAGDATAARRALMRGLATTTRTRDSDARAAVLDALRSMNVPAEPPPSDDPDQRIADLEQYIQDAQPDEIRWYVELATLYRDQGNTPEARRALMRALAMLTTTGGDPDARTTILDALRTLTSSSEIPPPPTRGDDLNAYAEALDTYIKIHQLDNIDLYLELADVYRETGDTTQARRTLMRALALITTTGDEDQRPRVLDALSGLRE